MADSIALGHDIIDLPLEVKADGEPGSFEGYGAIFGNTDRDGDVVARGAFADSLKARLPALLWQHNAKEPIGRFDEVREDDKGLYVKGRLSMSGRGREAYELLKMGALDGLSIGFVTREANREAKSGVRTITRAELMEVSLVTFPANELARVQNVKSEHRQAIEPIEDIRSFERMLRDNGFSRSRAKAITAKGFRLSGLAVDETKEIGVLVDKLQTRQRQLEEKAALAARLRLITAWGAWKRLRSVTLSRPTYFSLVVSRRSNSIARMPRAPIFLEVRYVSPTGGKKGSWQSSGMATPNRYLAAEGMQEFQIRGKTAQGFDEVKVSFSFR